jgi:hypothetical protein
VKKLLRYIRGIERAAYPVAFRQLEDVRTLADLREYCGGEPRVWTWDGGYCLVTDDEIVDLASVRSLTFAQLRTLVGDLAAHFGTRTVSLDAREGTSWRLLCVAQRRGLLEILRAEPWDWSGECFYEATVRFRIDG